jgi:hypothetical protein
VFGSRWAPSEKVINYGQVAECSGKSGLFLQDIFVKLRVLISKGVCD